APAGGPTTAPIAGTTAPIAGSGFTGGSGAMVDPYQLAPEDELTNILTGGQKYSDFDASTGRVGTAGSSLGGYAGAGFDFAQDAGNRDIGKSAKYAFAHLSEQAAAAGA